MIKRLPCIVFVFAAFIAAYGIPNERFLGQDFGDFDGFTPGNFRTDDSNSNGFGVDGTGFDGFSPSNFDPNSFGSSVLSAIGDALVSKICANQTLAELFLSDMRLLIDNLQSNGSFTNVLADGAQQVAYIKSSSSTALIASNCTGFFYGLKNAKDADRDAFIEKVQHYPIAIDALMKTLRNLLGRRP